MNITQIHHRVPDPEFGRFSSFFIENDENGGFETLTVTTGAQNSNDPIFDYEALGSTTGDTNDRLAGVVNCFGAYWGASNG